MDHTVFEQCPVKGTNWLAIEKHRSACVSAQPDQSLMGTLWVAKGPMFLQAEN